MKKLIIIIFFLFGQNIYSQCILNFQTFIKYTKLSNEEFDTYAQKNGWFYNTELEAYMCDNETKNNCRAILNRVKKSEYDITTYTFFDKRIYISFKEMLESQGKLSNQTENDGTRTINYIYNKNIISLLITTQNENYKITNIYKIITSR
ncbi:hypothetical protein [Flavobacterium eburneipallidum]|uniref:hypothetical protein n=1 Tax=Flavobacterium eburneipallidum TaxID=3003263 RepID=UPI0022AC19D9|nr:hypothetical protein [Flavobacterium eburneipallidum]